MPGGSKIITDPEDPEGSLVLCLVRETLRASGETRDWKPLRRLLGTHSLVTTALPLKLVDGVW